LHTGDLKTDMISIQELPAAEMNVQGERQGFDVMYRR
jgi:hypothetical protein